MNNLSVDHMWRSVSALIVLAVLFLLGGCSTSEIPGLQPVTGTVTYQGKPVEGALISFVGEGSVRPATAVSQSDGSYELYTLDSPGAQPGNYVVVVSKTQAPVAADEPDPGFNEAGIDISMQQAAQMAGKPLPKPVELLPAKYSNPTTSFLRFEVKNSGSNVFDLKLE